MATDTRIDGAAIWAGLDEAMRDRIGAIAVELASVLMLAHRMNRGDVDGGGHGLPEPLERAAGAAEIELAAALVDHVDAALPDLLLAQGGPDPRLPSLLGPVCRGCGCSQNDACAEGCSWAEPDLCSVCAAIEGGSRD